LFLKWFPLWFGLCSGCPGGYPLNLQYFSRTWWSWSQQEQRNILRLKELEWEE
jgi:hypothetical protein